MTRTEVIDLIDFLQSCMAPPPLPDGMPDAWLTHLDDVDLDVAVAAAQALVRVERRFPSLAVLLDYIAAERRGRVEPFVALPPPEVTEEQWAQRTAWLRDLKRSLAAKRRFLNGTER